MKIESVVLLSLAIALAILGIVFLIKKLSAARKAKARKLPYNVCELPLSPEEMGSPVTTIHNAEKAKWPVYWFEGPNGRERKRCGQLIRFKGRRAIIQLENGKKVRRKTYLVHLMDGTRLDVPLVREPEAKKLAETLLSSTATAVSSDPVSDPATEMMLDLEHHHGAVPTELTT